MKYTVQKTRGFSCADRAMLAFAFFVSLGCFHSMQSKASAQQTLCATGYLDVGVVAECGGFGWISSSHEGGHTGSTVINMFNSQDGYYCVATGVTDDPSQGYLGSIVNNRHGLAPSQHLGDGGGAHLTQVSMSCYSFPPDAPAEPPSPDDPTPPPA